MRRGASGRPRSSRRRRTSILSGDREADNCNDRVKHGDRADRPHRRVEVGAGQEQEARDDMDEVNGALVHLEEARFRDGADWG